MAFRKKLLVAAVGSALGATSFGALAAVDMDSEFNPIKFAKEVKADDSDTAYIPTGGTDLTTINKKLGWGFNDGEDVYIRLDLTMGGSTGKVKFAKTPILAGSIGASAVSDLGYTTDGGENETYVVYTVTAQTSGVKLDDPIEFSFGDATAFSLTGTSGNIELTYSVSTNEDLKPTNALVVKKVSLVEFVDSFQFSSSGSLTQIADVEDNFIKFTGDVSTAAVAKFKFVEGDGTSDTVYVYEGAGTATSASIPKVFSTDSTMDVVGDFTMTEDSVGSGDYTNAPSRVFISTTDNCGSNIESADVVTADKATFKEVDRYPETGNNEVYLCVTANGTPMREGEYSLVLNGDGNEPGTGDTGNKYILESVTLSNVGKIEYNGTRLITPYMTLAPGYISRIILSNTGAADIDYTATVITDDGNNFTLGTAGTGTVKAGTNLQINTSSLVESFSTKQRGAAIFNFVGANSAIQGVYQTVNLTSLEVQSIIMQRPGGGDGE